MALTIGIDVGGTKVLGGVVDDSGKILATHREATPKAGGAALTQTIADVAKVLLNDHPATAIGVSAAAVREFRSRNDARDSKYFGWNGVNLKEAIGKLVDLRLLLRNDANSAAWGEAQHGAGVGEDQMMMITVGTGIGGGAVIGGKLHRGAYGVAAEFGHLRRCPGRTFVRMWIARMFRTVCLR
jgi:glucokinase